VSHNNRLARRRRVRRELRCSRRQACAYGGLPRRCLPEFRWRYMCPLRRLVRPAATKPRAAHAGGATGVSAPPVRMQVPEFSYAGSRAASQP